MGLLLINGVRMAAVLSNAGYAIVSSIAFTIFLKCTGTVVGAIFKSAQIKGFYCFNAEHLFITSSCLILMGVKSTIVVIVYIDYSCRFFCFAAHSLLILLPRSTLSP